MPRHAAFSWEIRDIPGFDQASVLERFEAACARRLPAMRRVAVDATITTELMNGVPAFHSGAGSEAVALAATLTGQNATYAVSYGTEAGLFQEAGSPSVICGPGDIAQAHTPDEWIFATEIDRCLAFLDRLGDWAERN
mgnify:FL=1